MRILTHVCCGPCFTAVHELLGGEEHGLTAFYYNPNIHPQAEFRRRLIYFDRFCRLKAVPAIIGDYSIGDYFKAVGTELEKPGRCRRCYRLRLGLAAQTAAANNFDAFTTTLLISPYQYHDEIADLGRELAREQGVQFLYRDFRPLFRRSIELSKALALYRQKYCGCVFSESERAPEPPPRLVGRG